MLISCPSCPKMYRVPASAIPPEGREVSCSACGTVWHEQGLEAEVVSVGAGAFSAAPSPSYRHTAPMQAEPLLETGHNVVALWQAPDDQRDDPQQPDQDFAAKAVKPETGTDRTPSPAMPEAPSDMPASKAAAEVADFFNTEKWDLRFPPFQYLKDRIAQWREAPEQEPLNEGTTAALKFRERIRARERNRLT
ncbi:MAG: zinc-ribbon domain-containing protein, partial [Pseudomonadota bacterium]